jgi:demethylmenaquinone methyltransferase/2-methoxy-6-polyprenyl-1,4-benzoquinol methylase
VTAPALRPLYDAYSFGLIPRIGARVAGDAEAYRYLVESIRRFPDQRSLARMMTAAGFARVSFTNFTGGVVALHQGWAI